jgi:Fic family protein
MSLLEGNILSEEQVLGLIEGLEHPSRPQEYVRQEVNSLLAEYRTISDSVSSGEHFPLSPDTIRRMNQAISQGSSVNESVKPLGSRDHPFDYGNNKQEGPDENSEYLLEVLCLWLNSEEFAPVEGMEIVCSIIKAVVAHYYLIRIHPFVSRNGQTARFVEFQTLIESGTPAWAAHLLGHHYGLTRAEYYRHFDTGRASNTQPIPFLVYAVRCLKTALEQQLETIRVEQLKVAWENHVGDLFSSAEKRKADRRRRDLVLDLSRIERPVPLSEIRDISARVAGAYAKKALRTLMRDLEALKEMNLVERLPAGYRARKEIAQAFPPIRSPRK